MDRALSKTIISFFLIFLIGGSVMLGLSGCFAKKYSVDYCGQKDSYRGAKDSYRAGEKVELYFWLIATDTDYSFFLDDERISPDYDSEGGGQYIIRFTMPEHDVKLNWTSKNSMEIDVADDNTGVLLVDYYYAVVGTDGEDSHIEYVLRDLGRGDKAQLDVYRGDEENPEVSTSYLIPYKAVTECYGMIDSAKMREWNDTAPDSAIDGAVTAVKFRDDDGSYIRVSTDKMPEDGTRSMDSIKVILQGYALPENKIG